MACISTYSSLCSCSFFSMQWNFINGSNRSFWKPPVGEYRVDSQNLRNLTQEPRRPLPNSFPPSPNLSLSCHLPPSARHLLGTIRVFEAVSQPAALPGSRFRVEHRVEPQDAHLKSGPLQQRDLVLNRQVPGSKDRRC